MGIVFGAIAPHPPILVPQIGGARLSDAAKSKAALERLAKDLKQKNADTIIIFTPHGLVSQVSFPVYVSHVFEGNFLNFGCPKPVYTFKGDPELALQIVKACQNADITVSQIPETLLDHGVLVPLHYPYVAGVNKPIVPIAIAFRPLKELYEFGKLLAKVCDDSGKKIAIIASADMSHRLTKDAPAGFHPRGKEFDEKLVELVKNNDVEGILNFNPQLADAAGQDALWSIAMLLGALDGKNAKADVLSYEGPYGVGYMVAEYEVKS
ncbi:MAG: AmmeMemoRadiSam system protein B [Candidatus Margulisbacteria bacterium]|nr:AmmeMemoRadiSam system protein B [Candidatus Margulisiibacteriota bacterium]MBU1022429.1 AmmeMemoRadiSam system protein B [Candidatus Margulisiibacteriota bacterium]MBU1728413.1 AmmeMemoRadiSam system protein B [Candidatus Margulisiibacteriota bacterium]MBU1954560.1 AmmeMemoRadiSam system protein B [Candidatus Margulisiibacteriota bacterium]